MRLFLFAALCLPLCALADAGLPNQPYIYVQGTGEVQRPPDRVTLSFKLGSRDGDQAAANKKLQRSANAVLTLLDHEKVAEKDVVAESLSSEMEYEEENSPSDKPRALKGYHLTRNFSVLVRDVSVFPKLVDKLLTVGVEEFTSISPSLSNQDELAEQVREKALENARSQAEKTLKKEKVKIESLFAISPVTFTQVSGQIFQENSSGAAVFPAFSGSSKVDPSRYRLAPVSVTQTIHVIYLISPEK